MNTLTVQDEDTFLGAVQKGAGSIDKWEETLLVNGTPIEFKLDTGADVSVIPESTFKQLQGVTLQPSAVPLSGAGQQTLSVCGKFEGTLTHKTDVIQDEIFVVQTLKKALLGKPAIEALNLVARVNSVSRGEEIANKYPALFTGLGSLEGEYHIQLKEDATPFALTAPRRVALPLLPKVKRELERMEELGVISKIDEPTDWCSGMVVVPKANGDVRICVDLTKLNESVCRERHIMPSVELTLGQLGEAKVFSKLDANSGFWQIKLAEESSKLTTFITPFGRFRFNRLPFGITSAPEHYQKRMSAILAGIHGVVCMIDDVLVFGRTQEEHDKCLEAVLKRIQEAGGTLNRDKCEFATTGVKFLGQLVNAAGIRADPDKVNAILHMKDPTTVSEVRRFLGMANQLCKFTPTLAETAKPLRDLLSKQNQWVWGDQQKQAVAAIKEELSTTPVLALYSADRDTVISADASSYGLGAVLTQKQPDGEWRPVGYASRALTPTEQRYAQIEKEALAVTWACERFAEYLIGMQFHIETDHKPLVPLLGLKNLDELPIRIQRFRMRLMRFHYTISHVPGKSLITADALSRAPVFHSTQEDDEFRQEVNAYVNMVIKSLPATEQRLEMIKALQDEDETCKCIKQYCVNGWPGESAILGAAKPYLSVAAELTILDGLLMRANRIVIPKVLWSDILDKLHSGHQGLTKCRERARQSVWWPGLSKQLEELIRNCPECSQDRFQHAEPLVPSTFPTLPWEIIATDLFQWKGHTYLLIVDYFSRYIEISKLTGETSAEVIRHMKSIFARHGIPQRVMSDNGPQFASSLFKEFATEYGFVHCTSSPRYPQANGEAERAVKTIKALLKNADDPYLALLAYRATPLRNGYSPSELLMNRKLRTTVPMVPNQMRPSLPNYDLLQKKEKVSREHQKLNFDRRHKARPLKLLEPGQRVWISDIGIEGTVKQQIEPRSYLVTTAQGTIRRNRRHLKYYRFQNDQDDTARYPDSDDEDVGEMHDREPEPDSIQMPDREPESGDVQMPESESDGIQRTRSGRVSKRPNYLNPTW